MIQYAILLDEVTAGFYQAIALHAGLDVRRVLSESLFRLAGELSAQALSGRKENPHTNAENPL